MFVAEGFLSAIVEKHEDRLVSNDENTLYSQACRFLKLQHHIHFPWEKSLI